MFGVVLLAMFLLVYRAIVLREVRELEARFGELYRVYSARVPSVLPRITPYRAADFQPAARLLEAASRHCDEDDE